MARIETDPNYSAPTFSRATAATDLFKKEDVQNLAAAMSTHDHSTGKGVVLGAGSIPNGTITSAMIADATIDTADLKDGAVTSAKIADGTIATADLANASVTNAKLATDTARQNLLTNGGFEIWQRGNGPFTGSVFGSDRWQQGPAGTDTLSVSRDSGNVDTSSKYSAACTFTLGTGAGNTSIYQTNEDLWELRGRTISFSVRVRTSTANAVRIGFSDGSVTQSAFHSGSGAFETLTVTRSVPVGAAYVLTLIYFAASCTAYIDNAMLVIGNVAADYAPLHPADDLARCLRYYEKLGPSTNFPQIHGYGASASQQIGQSFSFAVKKAAAPTITVNGTFAFTNGSGPVGSFGPGVDGCYLQFPNTAAGQADAYSNNSGYISAESNP